MNALAPEVVILPHGVLVELRAEVDAAAVLKNVQIDTCVQHAVDFAKALLCVFLDFVDHRIAHTTQSVEAVILHLSRLIETSHEVRHDSTDLRQSN